ncbi:hypothetical protein [Shewanella sp. 6_MG-2023]|uniref:hypothetical protein n=1 Tax=Shewanella sp. 6_MG-2023 TaxID=3062660 RepID=UPI0026E23852|nr:hypothetical protein [Shewanella sp. 6_MG-2023]MDO6617653.1 hypothetical protein [Shewanella sp. 6_MG-2023]
MNRLTQLLMTKHRSYLEKKVIKHQCNLDSGSVFPQVNWLSYHIPKTAGTSLRFSLEKGLGVARIQYAYHHSFAKALSNGEPVWCNDKTQILHGHFAYHDNHPIIYPNARKMVWLRDPSQRAWSLLNHWLRVKSGAPYKWLEQEYLTNSKLASDTNLLFEEVILNNRFKNQFAAYEVYLNGLDKTDFAFVGQCENFSAEIQRLERILSVKLPILSLNKNQSKHQLNDSNRIIFDKHFQDECELYHDWISS